MHHDARLIEGIDDTHLKTRKIDEEIELRLSCDQTQLGEIDQLPIIKKYSHGEERICDLSATYYDTSDQDLRRAGMSLRVRSENARFIMTAKRLAPDVAGLRRQEKAIGVSSMTPDLTALQDILEPSVFREVSAKAFETIFSTEVKRRVKMLYLPTGTFELAIDDGQIIAGRRHEAICEVKLELLKGPSVAIWELAQDMLKEGTFRPSVRSKAIRGFDLAENRPPRLAPTAGARLGKAHTLQALFRVTATELVGRLLEIQPVAEDGSDHEAIHQYRVTLRRLRTLFGIARRLAPGSKAMVLDKEAKWLLTALSDARMWDVFLDETIPQVELRCSEYHGFAAIKAVAETLRVQAYKRAHASLVDPRTSRFQVEVMLWGERGELRHEASPYGIRTLHAAAGKSGNQILERQYRRLRKRGRQFRGLNNEERHQVRLSAKTLRYTIDFLAPALRRKGMSSRFMRRLSRLQCQLGVLNDIVTAQELLSQITQRDARPEVHHAAGFIVGWQAANLDQNIARLRRCWRRFRVTAVPWQ